MPWNYWNGINLCVTPPVLDDQKKEKKSLACFGLDRAPIEYDKERLESWLINRETDSKGLILTTLTELLTQSPPLYPFSPYTSVFTFIVTPLSLFLLPSIASCKLSHICLDYDCLSMCLPNGAKLKAQNKWQRERKCQRTHFLQRLLWKTHFRLYSFVFPRCYPIPYPGSPGTPFVEGPKIADFLESNTQGVWRSRPEATGKIQGAF